MQIKSLFDPSKDIYRNIEKVITYTASQEVRLKAEITEYIVTESIEDQFERLLTKMQQAMDVGGENEVGVWVSGFYGSGK
jgi:effector-binding domain-containing protein